MCRLFYAKAFIFLFVFCSDNWLFAQNALSLNDDHSNISVGTEYTTDRKMFGTLDGIVRQPAFNAIIGFEGKQGLSLSFAPFLVGNSDSTSSKTTSEYDIEAGYTLTLFKILNITPSYTHFIFDKNAVSIKTGFNDVAELSGDLSVKWWDTHISVGYGWGLTSDILVDASTAASLKIKDLLGPGNNLIFQPTADISLNRNQLGLLNIKKRTIGLSELILLYPTLSASDFLSSTLPAIVNWRKNHPALTAAISNKLSKRQAKANKKNQTSTILISDLFPTPKTNFGPTSIVFSLPITYNIKNFALNTTLSYYKPISKTEVSETYVNFGIT